MDHLPDRVFVLGPAATIQGIRLVASISSQPVQIPRTEWRHVQSSIFLPWISKIALRSWVRISKKGVPYRGDLAYVIGSSKTTDGLIIAVLPRLYQAHGTMEVRASGKQKGKQKAGGGRRRNGKAPQVLFNLDEAVARFGKAVKSSPIEDGKGFDEVFANRFAEREVILDPDTNRNVLSKAYLDLSEFDWVESKTLPHESWHLFRGKLFYRGLLILPVYGYGSVERVAVPPANEVIAFAESHIDPIAINRLLSQLHWQIGDHVRRADETYQLENIQLEHGCVSAFRLPAEPQPIVQELRANELRRSFRAGDGAIVLAGLHKGRTGLVLREEHGMLFLVITDNGDDVSNLSVHCHLTTFSLV